MEILFLLIPVMIIAGAVVFGDDISDSQKRMSKTDKSDLYRETIQKVTELINETEKLKFTLASEPTLKDLKKSSKVFLREEFVDLNEPQTERIAAHKGLEIISGVYIGSSTGKSYKKMTNLGKGKLTLLSDELIFASELESRTIKLNKINMLDSEIYSDGMRIFVKSRSKPLLFVNISNPILWWNYINILNELALHYGNKPWEKESLHITLDSVIKQSKDEIKKIEKML